MVEGFRLNYCPIAVNNASCKEPLKSLNISGSIREYYLTNLKAYTTYGIWMSMYSAKKQGPEDYTPLEITTLESGKLLVKDKFKKSFKNREFYSTIPASKVNSLE